MSKQQPQNKALRIVAGPDSIDDYNIDEIYEMAEITANGKKAIYGTRTVGLKSRTGFDGNNSSQGFMGFDFEAIMRNFDIFGLGGNTDDLKSLPSVEMAEKIYHDTGLLCSTEIMLPAIQLACIAKSFKFKPFMVWNSSVDQLGWHVRQMAGFAGEYGWTIGLKNGKWLGEDYETAEDISYEGVTSIEKTWDGLVDYAKLASETVLIQRGCDLPRKGEYRNLPIHHTALRTKRRNKGIKLYFDPSHALGPKMRDKIVDLTVEAMKMKIDETEYLYDGILIEVGTAKCDTHQHISVQELRELVSKLSDFRDLVGR
jgi:3-deoxy-D-arabino-heptulosonate 7-phosphate (DAHP) synthase